MSHGPDDRGGELKDLFFETAQELLQSLNEETLKLEKTPDDLRRRVRGIRRTVHTLKGGLGCGGFLRNQRTWPTLSKTHWQSRRALRPAR